MFQQLRMKASSRFQQAGVKGGEKRPARKLAGVLSTRLEELLYSAAEEAVCGGIQMKNSLPISSSTDQCRFNPGIRLKNGVLFDSVFF